LGFTNKAVDEEEIACVGRGIFICIAGEQNKQRDRGRKRMGK
jgi:hypothetical protein